MKYPIQLVLISTVLFFLIACANSGNQNLAKMDNANVNQHIQEGVTTKADIQNMLGQANDVDFDSLGNEKWSYSHIRSTPKASTFIPVVAWFESGSNDTKRKLVVVFNEDDVVSKYTYSQSEGETKAGLLG